MRVAVVVDNFGPYHVARLTHAARRMELLAVEVRPKSKVYGWTPPDLPGEVTRVTLLGADTGPRYTALTCALATKVGSWRPDAVAVPGWSGLASLAAMAWATGNGIPAVVLSDSNSLDAERYRVIENVKRRLVEHFSAGLTAGDLSRRYLVDLGLAAEATFVGYDVVDNAYFARRAEAVRTAGVMPELQKGRRMHARWRGKYFLASARFVPAKNLERLLRAFAAYREACATTEEAWQLVVLGDGGLRGELERRCLELGIDDAVHLPGFRQYDELPGFYGMAGAFVHPSVIEPWGLVVNEAMASGLPVLVSNRCGCAGTLVEEGTNGFTFDPSDSAALTDGLSRLARHRDLIGLGRASQARIADWGPERFASGLENAARYACDRGVPDVSRQARLLVRLAAEVQGMRP